MQELAIHQSTVPAELQEKVLLGGDLARLTPAERLAYYQAVCTSVGLNPLTRPFEYLVLNDRMVLYARKDCTDQLRDLHGISVEIASREVIDGVCVVTARAKNMTERIDESVGAVPFMKENGEWKSSANNKSYFKTDGTYSPLSLADRSNAMMKAETKAKRRVTLSICGLGMFDESEIDTLPDAKRAVHAEDPDRKFTHAELVALTHEMPPTVPPTSVLEPSTTEALEEMGVPITQRDHTDETPADPYIAKLKTCERSENAINATYKAIPDELKQDCYATYTAQLKGLKGKK